MSGYIPRWPFKFGSTYKEDCDVCIDEHLTNYKYHAARERELRELARNNLKLRPIRGDPEVKDHLNTYRDTHPARHVLMGECIFAAWHVTKFLLNNLICKTYIAHYVVFTRSLRNLTEQ